MNESELERKRGTARPHPARTRRTCLRTGRRITADEHVGCPYSFGELEDVLFGERTDFCEFRPGVDPVHFGFPAERRRHATG